MCTESSSWKTPLLDGRCFVTASKDGTIRMTTSDETPNDTVLELRDNNWFYCPMNIRVSNHPSYLKLHFGAE